MFFVRIEGMRTGIVVEVTAAARDRLEAIVADRNSPQKHVWRARIILLTADGVGTTGIVFDVRSAASAPQPPLPRQAEIRVRDSAGAAAGAHQYQQQ